MLTKRPREPGEGLSGLCAASPGRLMSTVKLPAPSGLYHLCPIAIWPTGDLHPTVRAGVEGSQAPLEEADCAP